MSYEKYSIALRSVEDSMEGLAEEHKDKIRHAVHEMVECAKMKESSVLDDPFMGVISSVLSSSTNQRMSAHMRHEYAEQLKMVAKYPNEVDSIADAKGALAMVLKEGKPECIAEAMCNFVMYLKGE